MTTVFKTTNDEWYPAYILCDTWNNNQKLVEVSFQQLDEGEWRVSVWGCDDCGMERDYSMHNEREAWGMFLQVIGMEDVDRDPLIGLGFVSA